MTGVGREQKSDTSWRKTIEEKVAETWTTAEKRAMEPAEPINPQRVTWELARRMPDRVIITSDSGSCANWYARDLKIRRGMMCSLSDGLASMGAAMPYAIATKAPALRTADRIQAMARRGEL